MVQEFWIIPTDSIFSWFWFILDMPHWVGFKFSSSVREHWKSCTRENFITNEWDILRTCWTDELLWLINSVTGKDYKNGNISRNEARKDDECCYHQRHRLNIHYSGWCKKKYWIPWMTISSFFFMNFALFISAWISNPDLKLELFNIILD